MHHCGHRRRRRAATLALIVNEFLLINLMAINAVHICSRSATKYRIRSDHVHHQLVSNENEDIQLRIKESLFQKWTKHCGSSHTAPAHSDQCEAIKRVWVCVCECLSIITKRERFDFKKTSLKSSFGQIIPWWWQSSTSVIALSGRLVIDDWESTGAI